MNPEPFVVPKGSRVMIGAPAQPYPDAVYQALTRALRPIQGIASAHIPQMYVEGSMPDAAQVLVVILSRSFSGSPELLVRDVAAAIQPVFPPDNFIDILPLAPGSQLIPAVIESGCCLLANEPAEQAAQGPPPQKKGLFSKLFRK